MKNYALALAATLSTLTALSQPVLDNRYHGAIGNQFAQNDITDTTLITVPATGANQSWDFSQLSGFFAIPGRYQNPASSAGHTYFPQANAAIGFSFLGINVNSFFTQSQAGMDVNGFYVGGTITKYAPAMTAIPGGLSMGDFSSYEGIETTFEEGGFDTTYTFNKERTQYVGYGTLQLPGGVTLDDAILLQTSYFSESGTDSNGPLAPSDSGTRYMWVAPGVGYPVLEMSIGITYDSTGSPVPDVRGTYLTNVVTSARKRIPIAQVSLSPQPAHDRVTLHLPATEAATTATLFDATGRQVAELPLRANLLDLSAIQPGLYWAEVQGRKTYRARLVKE